jgi:hypothetical protein
VAFELKKEILLISALKAGQKPSDAETQHETGNQ